MESTRIMSRHESVCPTGAPVVPVPLPLHRVRFALAFEAPVRLPRYPGSALRGLLGHGLRRTLCVTRRSECPGCPLLQRCEYAYFFETPALNAEQKRRFSAMPHPWGLDLDMPTPPTLPAGGGLMFRMSLLGRAGRSLPWLVLALEHAGQLGFGRDRARFRLHELWHEVTPGRGNWQQIDPTRLPALADDVEGVPQPPPAPSAIRLHLQTPLRLKRRGRLLTPQTLTAEWLFDALRKRFRDLLGLYGVGEGEYTLPDLPGNVAACERARRLRWQDWTRYSSRQKTAMQLGGVIGEWDLDISAIPAWWPLLWLGQWVHVGKQTSMGLGQYRIEALPTRLTADSTPGLETPGV